MKIMRNLAIVFVAIIGIILIGENSTSNVEDFYYSTQATSVTNENNAYQSNNSVFAETVNRQRAMTKEEAAALKGSGYHGTRPNSSAEDLELKAAMVKCKKCGMHSDNGVNSLCDECQRVESYGFRYKHLS